MEPISQVKPKFGNSNQTMQSTVARGNSGAMTTLMSQMRDYYPNQTLTDGTVKAWLTAWTPIVEKYGIDRFTNALWSRLRASDFFPLPQHIAEECSNLKILASELPGTRMNVYRCPACPYSCAADKQPHNCLECGSPLYKAAGGSSTDVEMRRYHEDIRNHPERFVRLGDIFKEAAANVAERRSSTVSR